MVYDNNASGGELSRKMLQSRHNEKKWRISMRYTFLLSAILASAYVTLSLPVRATDGDDKPPASGKSSALTVDEGVKALKAGIFKLKEAEVLSLFGPPTS